MKYIITVEREEEPIAQIETKYPQKTEVFKQVIERPSDLFLKDLIKSVNEIF